MKNMKHVEKRWLVRLVVVVLLITMVEQVTSLPTDRNSTLIGTKCDSYKRWNPDYFMRNLNTIQSSLRRQLTFSGYAAASTLINAEPVWGLAWCRGYLSIPDCLDCFDHAVDQLKVCGFSEGGHAIYSDCGVRYENYNFFTDNTYNKYEYDPYDDHVGYVLCDNKKSPQQIEFQKAAERLLLELQIAAPRRRNFYADSERQVAIDDSTVYAIAQCNPNVGQSDCSECLKLRSRSLFYCLPSTSGRAKSNQCSMRYENYNFITDDDYNFVPCSKGVVYALCDNKLSPQQIAFQKAAKKLLLDLQIAAPRTTNFYAASTRKVATDNATVYAIAQCNLNISQRDCLECLNLRSRSLFDCLPSTSGQATDTICFMRYDKTPFFGQNQTTDIASLLCDGDSCKMRYIIGKEVVGGVSFLLLLLAFLLWLHRCKKAGGRQQVALEEPKLKGAVYYNYKDLELATNNFSEVNKIGKGGFGEVFMAILDDKKVVAVKKLRGDYAKAKVGFENEILLISKIRHRNLLCLLGWSSEGSNLFLVLEYIANGSLDKFLWGAKRGDLSWKSRYDIILGIAQGLAHLHKESHVRIVHRDIKSSNILLDDDFKPKIADFGLAIFQPENHSHVTTKFAGTLGYTPPEYVLYGHLSDKVDTFSFGIVILEIVSGRKCTSRNFDASSTNGLLEYAWKLYESKNLMKLVDETMDVNQYKEEHVMNMIEIALLCTQSPASKRPTMSEVVLMLRNDSSFGERQLTRPNYFYNDLRMQVGPS